MPPCGQSLVTDPSRVSPVSVVVIFLPPSMELIHQQIVSPSPCCLAACVMTSNQVLSKAPLISRKAPSVTSLFYIASSVCVIT